MTDTLQEWIDQRRKDWGDLDPSVQVSVSAGELQAFLSSMQRYIDIWPILMDAKGVKGIPTIGQIFGEAEEAPK